MRKLLILLTLIPFLAFQCEKDKVGSCKGNLQITSVTIDPASNVANGISFHTDLVGANLCYSFEKYLITVNQTGNVIEITASGSVPCARSVCAQAIYNASPPGNITRLSAGTYTLRFLNAGTLFYSTSVTIN